MSYSFRCYSNAVGNPGRLHYNSVKALNHAEANAEKRRTMPVSKLLYEKESYLIRGACFALYKELGCGHKEVIYQRGLLQKLSSAGLTVSREEQIPVKVEGKKVGVYIPDVVVNGIIMLELKASSMLTKQDIRQFWQYLHIAPYKLGFLVNFGKPGGVQIIRRVYDTARGKIPRNSV